MTRIRCEGTSEPRRNVEDGGEVCSAAQSSGEWPGARRTFLEGREAAGRVEAVGAREDFFVAVGGTRREEAAEGRGRRVVDVDFGIGGFEIGLGGGGISEDCRGAGALGFPFAIDGAGGIFCLSEITGAAGKGPDRPCL